ncbi:two-component system sensor histidine kinase MprB [Spinactinospora alkalitolerans]|uniref:histidine kinase n=1 Tax=Spinactinospora alkalitolerans TaxID=687207 RepID=A0A852TN02_9ACTN|nr:HAMP domain-containing sensor histidine kinase [Spinactinospora alkalitolerans]NYE45318.1 two-component system sensor histidine kinase MprB [Spinactinospora alkalitolerans]
MNTRPPSPGLLRRLGGTSLGTRFAVTFALVAAVVIALVGSLAYNAAAVLIRTDAQQEFDSTVSGLADDLRASAMAPGGGGQLNLLHSETFTFQLLASNGSRALPVNERNQVEPLPVTESDRRLAKEGTAGLVQVREDVANGERYRIATLSMGEGRGAVQIAQRLSPMERLLDTLAVQMAVVGGVVLVGAGFAGWLVARRITGRLVRLTEAAEYVSSTGRIDLVAPDGASGGRDEVGRLGNAFNAMLARLANSKEDQRRLVQNASHELRTPLTSLRTNVSVMKRFDRLPPDAQQRLIDDLQGETRELTDLVDELVQLATETREDEEPQEVELRELAERVAARTGRRTGREITVDADDTVVFGRPHALERALSNPVENAAKFDAEGTQPIEIAVRSGRVEVRDRGPGVDPAELEHVFDRFYRATSARSLPGSGLGLSMVHDIAASHGGRVFARNREGGGAVIGFELPAVRPS